MIRRLYRQGPEGGSVDSYALRLESESLKGAAFVNSLTAPFSPERESWHHLAYTFDKDTKQQALYIDGLQVAGGGANSSIVYEEGQPLLLGCKMQNGKLISFLHGRIDEASIYNRALKGEEIASIFNAGAAGKLPRKCIRVKDIRVGETHAVSMANREYYGRAGLAWRAIPG